MVVIDFDFLPTLPFFSELTKQQEPLLTERKASSLDLHHTGLGPRQNLAENHIEKIILFRERKPCLFQLQAEKDSGQVSRTCYKELFQQQLDFTWSKYNVIHPKIRKLQTFEDICYRLQILYFYGLR